MRIVDISDTPSGVQITVQTNSSLKYGKPAVFEGDEEWPRLSAAAKQIEQISTRPETFDTVVHLPYHLSEVPDLSKMKFIGVDQRYFNGYALKQFSYKRGM